MGFLRSRLAICGLIWGLTVLSGFVALADFQNSPGASSDSIRSWPDGSELDRKRDGLDLIMFLHPHCPCSRAGLRELERVMARSGGRLRVRLVFVQPEAAGASWTDTDLRSGAQAMTGVEVLVDVGGAEARRFGALTSGQCYLFAPDGALLFAGGITGSRSHEGDNLGSLAVASIAGGREPGVRTTSVYGCPLLDEIEANSPGDPKCCKRP